MPRAEPDPAASLDDFVEAYEAALAVAENVRLQDYVPPVDHPDYPRIVAELMRIDLEHGWARGTPQSIADYRAQFRELLSRPDCLADIAFEEFRQRRRAGEVVVREEYAEQYGIDVSGWPTAPPEPAGAAGRSLAGGDQVEVEWDLVSTRSRLLSGGHSGYRSRLFETADLQVGGRFAGCRIIQELGRGASSRVYLARQLSLADRLVVLKVTPDQTVEPDRLARLQHTNIVPIYSVHQVGGLYAMCMPYLGATTLSDWVRYLRERLEPGTFGADGTSTVAAFRSGTWRAAGANPTRDPSPALTELRQVHPQGPAPAEWQAGQVAAEHRTYEAAMLSLASPLAQALAHAHEQGILHLDLKPANMLLTDDGRPMLLDFHLAAATGGAPRDAEIIVGGTLPYMSPEQIRSLACPEPIDARSDIFSFGVVLFELLTGRLPFPLRTDGFPAVLPLMLQDRQQLPPLIDALLAHAHLAPAVAAIIHHCLQPVPAHRYQSAADLAEDLERHQQDLPLRFAGNPSWRERLQKWIRRHPRLTSGGVVTAAATVLLATGGLVWAVREDHVGALEAQQVYHRFASQVAESKAGLSVPVVVQSDLPLELERARRVLVPIGALERADWTNSRLVQHLQVVERQQLREEAGELLYLLAAAEAPALSVRPAGVSAAQLAEALDWNSRALACYTPAQAPQAVWTQRIELLDRLNRRAEADEARSHQAAREPLARADRVLQATGWTLQGKYQPASELLDRLLYEDPRDFNLWFLAGNCHFARHQFAEAEGCYAACISLRPDSYTAYYQRGICRLRRQRYAEAANDFEQVGRLLPGDLPALVSHALALQGAGRDAEAVAELTQALDRGFPETRLYFIREELYRRLGQSDLADNDHQQGLRLEPTDSRSWVTRGIERIDQDPHGALEDFRQALAIDQRSYEAWRNIAHVQSERLNQPQAAVDTLTRLLEMVTDDPLAWSGRGVLLARSGQSAAARTDAQAALAQRREPMVVYQVACILALTAADDDAAAREALPLLAEALAADVALGDLAATDADLARIRDNELLQHLITAARFLKHSQGGAEPAARSTAMPASDLEIRLKAE